ncbi:methyl-accepting chemotaxis protein [Paenibacillus apiarius]|uniref:methyl-accepting chemotaxis protein n=1 Tax=Paenibacillus apiarius TaxID=46240 RepID=UPI003B3B100E
MDWFKRSIIPKLILVSYIIVMAISGFFIMREYSREKALYLDFLQQKHELLVKMELTDVKGAIRQASDMMQSKEANAPIDDSIFRLIRGRLNIIAKDDIVNAFLFVPEGKQTGAERTAFRMLQANSGLEQQGFTVNKTYDMPPSIEEAYKEMTKKGQALSDEFLIGDDTLISAIAPVKDDRGKTLAYFVLDFDYTPVKQEFMNYLTQALITGMALGLVGMFILTWYIYRKIKPLNVIHRLSEQAAEGDLTVKLDVKTQDEIGRLSTVFNHMIERLGHLLQSVQQASNNVSISSQELKRGAEETAIAAQEAASAMMEVTSGALEQQHNARETKAAMGEIATGVQQIAASSDQVALWMQQSSAQADTGRNVVERAVEQMNVIQSASEETHDAFSSLSEVVNQINGAASFIQNSVKQTELLALNASIEAARAGEHGRGFQVVASEVRQLAEHSKHSLHTIMELIREVHAKQAMTEQAALRQQDAVLHGLTAVQEADDAFSSISAAIAQTKDQVEQYRTIAKQIAQSCEEVSRLVEQLSSVAESSHDHTSRVAATTEQQSALTEQIAASADSLLSLSRDMESMLTQFKVNSDVSNKQ